MSTSGIEVSISFTSNLLSQFAIVNKTQQVLPISCFGERCCQLVQLRLVDVAHTNGRLFGRADFEPLAFFNGFDEHAGLNQ